MKVIFEQIMRGILLERQTVNFSANN